MRHVAPRRENAPGWDASERVAVLGVAVVTALTRLAWRTTSLSTWDSALFALAIEDYDVYSMRPHAPGYPVFIALARVVHLFVPEANAALVVLSTAFSVGSVVLLYALVRRFGPPRAALVASLLFAFAPVLVVNGVSATTYPAEAFFSVLVALLACDLLRRPSTRGAAVLAGVFGLALGVRSSLLFYLAPLVAVAVFAEPLRSWWHGQVAERKEAFARLIARGAAGGAAGAAAVTLWFVPMALASGGLAQYQAAVDYQTGRVVFAFTVFEFGWPALEDHAVRLWFFVRHEVGVLPWVLLGAAAVGAFGSYAARAGRTSEVRFVPPVPWAFVALWTLPSVLFYLAVFDGWGQGPIGYALVFLPAVYLIVGLAADWWLRGFEGATSHLRFARPAAIALTLALFVPVPVYVEDSVALMEKELWAHDDWTDQWGKLPQAFPPETTAIMATYSWAYAKWYQPDYLLWAPFIVYDTPGGDARLFVVETHERKDTVPLYALHVDPSTVRTHEVPPHIETVVIYDFQIAGENDGNRLLTEDVNVTEAFLPGGWRVLTFQTDGRPTVESYFRPLEAILADGPAW